MRSSFMASMIGIIIMCIVMIVWLDGRGESEAAEPEPSGPTISMRVMDHVDRFFAARAAKSAKEKLAALKEEQAVEGDPASEGEAMLKHQPANAGQRTPSPSAAMRRAMRSQDDIAGATIVKCQLSGQIQYLRRADCEQRGGELQL